MASDTEESPVSAWKAADKRHFVMAHALELLIDVGYQGLTMRAVAERCGMSLSNVQYYFRSKEDLMTLIADRYFGACDALLTDHFNQYGAVRNRETLFDLVALFLEHGQKMTDMCRVFRELWAIASRNDQIAAELDIHYRRLRDTLAQNIDLPVASSATLDQMLSLFLVMSEGYSIVGKAQPLAHKEAIAFFTELLIKTAEGLIPPNPTPDTETDKT